MKAVSDLMYYVQLGVWGFITTNISTKASYVRHNVHPAFLALAQWGGCSRVRFIPQ